jgi:hypothetical protein
MANGNLLLGLRPMDAGHAGGLCCIWSGRAS